MVAEEVDFSRKTIIAATGGRQFMQAPARSATIPLEEGSSSSPPVAAAAAAAATSAATALQAITAGDQVYVGSTGQRGIVRFVGATQFAAGEWLGLELEESVGKNDGSVKGQRYFECPDLHGLFVRPTSVLRVEDYTDGIRRPPHHAATVNLVSPAARAEASAALEKASAAEKAAAAAKEAPPMSPSSPSNSPSAATPSTSPKAKAKAARRSSSSQMHAAAASSSDVSGAAKATTKGKAKAMASLPVAEGTAAKAPSVSSPTSTAAPEAPRTESAEPPAAEAAVTVKPKAKTMARSPTAEALPTQVPSASSPMSSTSSTAVSTLAQPEVHAAAAAAAAVAEAEAEAEEATTGKAKAKTMARSPTADVLPTQVPSVGSPKSTTAPVIAAASQQRQPELLEAALEGSSMGKPKTTMAQSPKAETTTPTPTKVPATASSLVSTAAAAAAQLELAEAAEDHDPDRIRRAMPKAMDAGVSRDELEGAHHILNFELQQSLLLELDRLRSTVKHLESSVEDAERRAEMAVDRAMDLAVPQPGATGPPWALSLQQRLEQRLWQGLEVRVDNAIQMALSRVGVASIPGGSPGFGSPISTTSFDQQMLQHQQQQQQQQELERRAAQRDEARAAARLAVRTSIYTVAPKVQAQLQKEISEEEAAYQELMNRWDNNKRKLVSKVSTSELGESVSSRASAASSARGGAATMLSRSASRRLSNIQPVAPPTELPSSKATASSSSSSYFAAGSASQQQLPPHLPGSVTTSAEEVAAALAPRPNHPQQLTSISEEKVPQSPAFPAATPLLPKQDPALRKEAQSGARFSVLNVLQAAAKRIEEQQAKFSLEEAQRAARSSLNFAFKCASLKEQELQSKQTSRKEAASGARFSLAMAFQRASVKVQEEDAKLLNRSIARSCARASLSLVFGGISSRATPPPPPGPRPSLAVAASSSSSSSSSQQTQAVEETSQQQQQQQHRGHLERLREEARSVMCDIWEEDEEIQDVIQEKATLMSSFSLFAMGQPASLSAKGFRNAIREVQPDIEPAQVAALWAGFQDGVGTARMAARTFCALAEAVQESDERAAEFADMPVQEYTALQGGDWKAIAGPVGAVRMQMQAVDELVEEAPPMSVFSVHAMGEHPLLNGKGFRNAMREVARNLSPEQIAALWRGFEEGVGTSRMESRTFCSLVEAVRESDERAAEFADMPVEEFVALGCDGQGSRSRQAQEEEEAARLIQRQRRASKDSAPPWETDLRGLYRPWAEAFNSLPKTASGNLDQAAFHRAMTAAHARLRPAQVDALWSGYLEGTGLAGINLRNFCLMAQAVSNSDEEAAEFADMPAEEFARLG
eukprot:CAMPEP_0206541588 /NCGR_PEP_ID=MMETSP0325_2-20121206/9699_1 /ASSEMBLY_ACC=CAM_ASM_000347 /TAXON_ID=2866 /ORGANISM="Crypthecodinium cohnii, Strain Seligo" /LENGTH=1330 /DNA_ID=CAMNT_0054039549 /DNA_START=44 /DNA_END=4036 /DNA_ORIENTATION=+